MLSVSRTVCLFGLFQATTVVATKSIVSPNEQKHRDLNDIFSGTLESGVPVSLNGDVPGEVVASYEFTVEEGAESVECVMSGGSGDG